MWRKQDKKVLGSSEVPTKEAQQRSPSKTIHGAPNGRLWQRRVVKLAPVDEEIAYPNNGSLNRRQLDWSLSFLAQGLVENKDLEN